MPRLSSQINVVKFNVFKEKFIRRVNSMKCNIDFSEKRALRVKKQIALYNGSGSTCKYVPRNCL